MGLFREKNRAFDPLEVARVLRQSFVNRPANDLRGELTIPSGAAESVFEPKAFFFRLASTIPALLVQEENYPRVSEAREAGSCPVFGKRYRECISEEGIPKNEEMGKSFKEPLETLIFENHHAEQGQGEKVFLNLFRMAMRSFATLIAPENKYAGYARGKRMAHRYRRRGTQSRQVAEVLMVMAASPHRSPGIYQRRCQGVQVVARWSLTRRGVVWIRRGGAYQKGARNGVRFFALARAGSLLPADGWHCWLVQQCPSDIGKHHIFRSKLLRIKRLRYI